jgi:hypothetical protein
MGDTVARTGRMSETFLLLESLDDIRAFAGDDVEAAVRHFDVDVQTTI